VCGLAFSPDGAWLVSSGTDDTACIWDARTGAARVPPVRMAASIVAVELAQGDTVLFTRQVGGLGRVWDALTGEPLTPILSPAEAHTWKDLLAPDARPTEALLTLGRALSGHKLDAAGGLVALGPAELFDEWARLRAQSPEACVPSAEQVLAWRRRQVAASEAAGQWHAAAWHLDRLLQAEPNRAEHRQRRAAAFAKLEQWRLAADETERAIRLQPGLPELWYQRGVALGKLGRWDEAAAFLAKAIELRADPRRAAPLPALVALEAGNRAGYSKECALLLKAAQASADPEVARLAAWACVLAKEGAADGTALLAVAEKAAADSPKGPAALLVLGAALYRAGKADEALTRLEEAARGQPDHVPTLLFLAMAQKKAGQADKARETLAKVADRSAALTGGNVPLAWDARLELLLLDEAEATLR
jgi:tetratricopeptide (TPR) repeat protein